MNNFNFDEFIAPYRDDLFNSGKSRYHNYEYVIKKLVAKNKPLIIIETGTMWSGIDDNMGAFTLIFADLIKNWTGGKLITIDISEKSINNCKETTKDYSDVIDYVLSDSISYLKSMSDDEVNKVDYIYFDSYDLSVPDPAPSQLHHYRELDSVYYRLSDDAILSVDDNFMPGSWVEWHTYDSNGHIIEKKKYDIGDRMLGKGTLIDLFLLNEGWKRCDDFLHLDSVHLLTYEKPNPLL
jgi:predicted O-methyltransferase YrrM